MHAATKRANRVVIIAAAAAGVAAGGRLPAGVPAAGGPPDTAPAAAPAVPDPELDRILTRLEQREVRDLRAGLVWQQWYVLDSEDDLLTKRGEIWYQQAEPVARFLIQFRERISGTRKDRIDERHLFDGCWYTELQSATKTVQRREIRRPDDPANPYKVGEGVFPLPFGQKKADILREFAVERIPPSEGDPPATDHVRLVPREGTRTGASYRELDFWVSREGPTAGLPVKVRVAKLDGTGKVNSHITIGFSDVRLNTGFSSSLFEIRTPPGYTEAPPERLEPVPPPPGAGS